MTIEELRELNPGHWNIPSDEDIQNRIDEKARQVEEAEAARIAAENEAEEERKRELQSNRDQIASLVARMAELGVHVDVTDVAPEAPAEEEAQG